MHSRYKGRLLAMSLKWTSKVWQRITISGSHIDNESKKASAMAIGSALG